MRKNWTNKIPFGGLYEITNNINLSYTDDRFWSQNMISRANVVFYRNEK